MEIFDVRQYGAAGDGIHLDTMAVQQAMDLASEAGGIVYFPKGTYRVGTIRLKSHVTMTLGSRAVIKGSERIEDYPENVSGCVEAPSFSQVLFWGTDIENFMIAGSGRIEGSGYAFSDKRPMMLRILNGKNITIRDVTLKDSASWCCHMIGCEDVTLDKVKIDNHANHNNDGFDLDSCRFVTIQGCRISSGDDAVCLKSTTLVPCENITITGCILSSETAAVKFGTSSKTGFRNIVIENCIFYDCPMGTIKLLCVDGGILENVMIGNIEMDNVGSPLFIRAGRRNLSFEQPAENDFWGLGTDNGGDAGIIRNITIHDIHANVTAAPECSPMMVTGLAESRIQNLSLCGLNIVWPGGGTEKERERTIEEDPCRYPEQYFFGVLPAYALYARHVEGLHMEKIHFVLRAEDARESVVFEDVEVRE